MKINYLSVRINLICILLLFTACSSDKKKKVETQKIPQHVIVENINVILENSGSMAGYLNGNQFKKTITEFVAELHKYQLDKNIEIDIKNLSFFTISDNLALNQFSGDAYDFCNAINNKELAIGKTSPMDDLVKLLVDSSRSNTIDILISDFVIDKKVQNVKDFIQGRFNIIFNSAKQRGLGLVIYRLTSDFTGNYLPAKGRSIHINNSITRPYFLWMIGPIEQLNILREKLQKSSVFFPENEISFGLPFNPISKEVLTLSNRTGSWRFKDGEFIKAGLSKDKLKFTIAFNLENLPNYINNINNLNEYTLVGSSSLNIPSYIFYSRDEFASKIHKKEKDKLYQNTHFLEINISQMNAASNILVIALNKIKQDWYLKFSTDDDSSLDNDNNLKTFMLMYLISGVANAYGDLNSNTNYFQFNYKINQ